MANDLDKLLGFLSSPSADVKNAVVDIVRRLTGPDEGLRSLAAYSAIVFPRLVRRIYGTPETAAAAAEALVNLYQDAYLATKLVSHGSVATAINVLYKSPDHPALVRGLVLLLTNLTQVESGVAALLQIGNDKVEGLNVAKLVRLFCRSSSTGSADDTFELVASILVNISKVEAGRKILLDPRRALLKQVIHQFDSTNPLRKKGVAGTIRNCCFEADNQLQNLLSISEYLWPALLLPVAGNKIYNEEDRSKMPPELANALSHEREIVDDPEIRQQALEAIYLISSQEAGRRALLSVNGLRILQVGYKDEEDPKVMKAYEQITSLVGTQSDPVNVKGLQFNGREWTITIKAGRYGTLHCGPFDDVNEAQSFRDVIIYKLGIHKHAGMVHKPTEVVNMGVWKYCEKMNLDDFVKLLKNKEFCAGYKSYVRKGKGLQEGRKLSSLEKKAPSFVQDVGVLGVQSPFSPSPGERGTTSVGRAIGRSFSTLPGNKVTLSVGRTLESSFSRLHGEKGPISFAKELESSFSPILRKKGAGSARKDGITVDDGDKENTPSALERRTLLLRERKVANKEFTPGTENGGGNANAEDIFLLKTLMIKLQQQVETAETALSAAKGFSNEVLNILANY